MSRWSALGALLLLLPNTAVAADYWVATDGDDGSGDGSQQNPWATIAYAVNQGISADGGHTVHVADGSYSGLNTLSRGFVQPVVVRAENDYGATLTNVAGGQEVLRVYLEGSANLTISGFVMTNLHPSYTCPNGRETYYLVHLQDVSDITLENNLLIGNNAPGTCNEVLKINRSGNAYPRNIVVRGNVFSEPANADGSDLIDAVRPGEITISDNIFFGHPGNVQSQSFITLKRQAPPDNPSTHRYLVQRNVFLSYSGKTDQAFVQLGEDGVAELEITDALIENNLFLGNSPDTCAAPMQFKGAARVTVRANTIAGDLPSGSFGFRIGTEGSNPQVGDISMTNNIFADPTGTMTNRLVNTYGDVDLSSVILLHNLYGNAGHALPNGGAPTPGDDSEAIVSDPLIESDQAGLVTPIWDDASASFASGETTIRGEFLRLVEAYGALGQGSPAADAASASDMPTDDIRGYPRDATPDLGAYELGAVPGQGGAGAGGGGGGAGGGASSAGAGGSAQAGDNPTSEEGGCGCRTTPGPAGTSAWLLALVSLIAAGRVTRSRRTRT